MPNGSKFVEIVCQQREQIPLAMTVIITMALLLLVSALYVSPGDEAFPILVLDFVLIGLSLLFFGGTYWYCIRRSMDE